MSKKVSKAAIVNLINKTGGKVFTVSFTKKDGTLRVMNARTGVKSKLRGGKSTTAHVPNLITVFDMKAGQYRCINTDTIKSAHINKDEYIVEGEA